MKSIPVNKRKKQRYIQYETLDSEFEELFCDTHKWIKTCLEDAIAVTPIRIMR
jgi:hypothetical protein